MKKAHPGKGRSSKLTEAGTDPSAITFSAPTNHWSVNLLGRLLFGSLALLAAAGFGLFLVATMFVGKPSGWLVVLWQGSVGGCLLVATVFLSLATVHAWFPSKWSERWLTHYLPRGGIVVVLFVLVVIVRGIMVMN